MFQPFIIIIEIVMEGLFTIIFTVLPLVNCFKQNSMAWLKSSTENPLNICPNTLF